MSSESIKQFYEGFHNLKDNPINIYNENLDKASKAAWHDHGPAVISFFILPERPHVGLWYTALIQWDSYAKEELIVKDLKAYGIEWVMDLPNSSEELKFKTPEEFAKEVVKLERYPKGRYFNYNFPPELSATNFK